jgi:hypothetical protein
MRRSSVSSATRCGCTWVEALIVTRDRKLAGIRETQIIVASKARRRLRVDYKRAPSQEFMNFMEAESDKLAFA